MNFKNKSLILILLLTEITLLFLSCKTKKDYKSDAERAIQVDLPYTFKSKKAEQLSVRAFELKKNKDFTKAIDIYKQAIQTERGNPKLFFDISECYANLKEFNEAINMLDSAISLDKSNPFFYSNRGFYNWKLYKDSNAINDYKKAILLDSTNWAFYSNLSIAYYTTNNVEDACKVFNTSIKLGLTLTTVNEDKYLKKVKDLCY